MQVKIMFISELVQLCFHFGGIDGLVRIHFPTNEITGAFMPRSYGFLLIITYLNKKPVLHPEQRAPHQISFRCTQFLASVQKGFQTYVNRAKNKVNLLVTPFGRALKYLFLNEICESFHPRSLLDFNRKSRGLEENSAGKN